MENFEVHNCPGLPVLRATAPAAGCTEFEFCWGLPIPPSGFASPHHVHLRCQRAPPQWRLFYIPPLKRCQERTAMCRTGRGVSWSSETNRVQCLICKFTASRLLWTRMRLQPTSELYAFMSANLCRVLDRCPRARHFRDPLLDSVLQE